MPNSNVSLTASNIRYLLAVYMLSENSSHIRSSEVAAALGISKPSVHSMMNTLISMNLIEKDKYSYICLTQQGKETASRYQKYYQEIFSMLDELLPDKSEIDGAVCALLAGISPDGLSALCEKREQMKASI